MNNPVPLLHEHCGLTPLKLGQVLGCHQEHTHRYFEGKPLTAKEFESLRDYTMVQWGQHPDGKVRRLLWRVYYPDDRPNIFQVLYYRCDVTIDKLMKAGRKRMAERTVRINLKRARIPLRQLRNIAGYAKGWENELASKKRQGGPDPRYMEIHRALHDPKRMFRPGEIIAD